MEYKSIFSMILLILGSLFIYLGGRYLYSVWIFKKTAIKTIGTIVKINTKPSKNKMTLYGPVVSFKLKNDTTVEFASNTYSRTQMNIGDTVGVLYPEANPTRAVMNDISSVWGLPLLFIGVGIGSIISAAILYYRNRI